MTESEHEFVAGELQCRKCGMSKRDTLASDAPWVCYCNRNVDSGSVSLFEEKRFKILRLGQNLLIDILNLRHTLPEFLALPVTDQLPADCFVVSVSVSWHCRCIEAIVCSKEFPPCPEGEEPEVIPGVVSGSEMVRLRIVGTQE